MSIFLDSSSGDEDYWVYLVDKAKQPAPLDWTPQAELVREVRQLARYDPKLETLDGFLKLWEGSAAIMGRGVPLNHERNGQGPCRPARVIYRGSMSFRSKGSDRLNVRKAVASRPAWFSRLSGTFRKPIVTVSFACVDPGAMCSWTANWSRRFWGKYERVSSTLNSRKDVIASSSCNMPARGKMVGPGCGGRIREERICMGIP